MFYLDRKLLSIDFLKGIAMIMVILVHYNLSFSAKYPILAFGQMGCPLFFVVSGFLSARSYHKKCLSNKNAKKEFLFSKIKSIAPAWWLLIFSLFIINFISLKLSGKVITGKYDFIALIVNALFLHGMTPSYMNTFSGGWYIGTLMILYFLTPYIYSLYLKFNPKKICMVAFCLSFSLMLIISITTKMFFPSLLGAITGRSSYGYFSFINQAPVFSLGIYLFFSYDAKKKANGGVVFEAIVSACLFLAALILFMKPKILLSYTISEYMVSVSAFLLLRIFIKLETEEKIRIIPPIKAIVKVGQNSLYIYLTHFLVLSEPLKIIKNILLEHTNKISDALLYFGLLIPTIFMCYYVGIVYKTIVRLVTTNSNKDKKKSNL